MSGAVFGVAANLQYRNLRRLVETLERQKPDTVPCSKCGKPILVGHIIIRDAKILCEECYEKQYTKKINASNRNTDYLFVFVT